MGDFTINLLKQSTDGAIFDFCGFMCSSLFAIYISQPTRVTSSSANQIVIFFNAPEFHSFTKNFVNYLSDHFAQFLLLKRFFKHTQRPQQKITKRDFSRFNADELKDRNWNMHCLSSNDINISYENFLRTLHL